jgi:hypothetical protein
VNVHDVEATTDVFAALAECSDTLDVDEAVAMRDALEDALTKGRIALALIDQQLVDRLESPRVINGRLFRTKPNGKWRPDQSKIRSRVIRRVATTDEGEVRPTLLAVEEAVALMTELYVGPSDMPKVKGLRLLEVSKDDVAEFERTGMRLSIEAVPEEAG